MANTEDVRQIIASTAALVLETDPSASVALRIARDVLADERLTAAAYARGIPDDHPAKEMLRKVEFRDTWMKTDVGGNVRGGVGDAFHVALNAGLTPSDPLIRKCVEQTAAFLERCERIRPWENDALHGQERFTTFAYIVRVPGMLSQVAPEHPIVIKYRDRAIALLESHIAADDFSVAHQDQVWQAIYGGELASQRFLRVWRSFEYWEAQQPLVFIWDVFRLIGTASAQIEEEVRRKYYDLAVESRAWGGTKWMAQIVNEDFENPGWMRPDRFSQAVAIQFDTLCDLQRYPYWRATAAPFVDWVLEQRQPDGFWDFGTPHNGFGSATRCKISESWRGKNRKLDWTTQVLLLLKAYVTSPT